MITMERICSRQNALQLESSRKLSINPNTIIGSISNPKINIDYLVNQYLSETCNHTYADKAINGYMRILKESYKKNHHIYPIFESAMKKLILHADNQKNIKNILSESILPDNFIDECSSIINTNMIIDRVLNNHKKISSRFKLNYISECISDDEDMYTVIEGLGDLVNTYDMPIHKKIIITLEEAMYLYNKLEKDITSRQHELIESISNYYISSAELLNDKMIDNINRAISVNEFVIEPETIFSPEDTISNAISRSAYVTNIDVFKNALIEISACNSLMGAKVTIKRVITFIYNAFVISGCEIDLVLDLYRKLYSLISIVGESQKEIIDCIIETTRDKFELNSTEKSNELYYYLKSINRDIISSSTPVYEAYDLFLETNVYASDVKETINKYKKLQKKDVNILLRAFKSLYTKSPESIIDDIPHIFNAIRIYGWGTSIIITAGAGTPLLSCGLFVVAMTDFFIGHSIKRNEIKKMVKFFKSEQDTIKKKLNKSNVKEKDSLEKYLDYVEKATDKLEQYERNLYSEKEQDAMDMDLTLESTSISNICPVSIGEYFNTYHDDMVLKMNCYINDILNKYGDNDNITLIKDNGIEVNLFFKNISSKRLANFITSSGYLQIPIFCVKQKGIYNIDYYNSICKSLSKDNLTMLSFDAIDGIECVGVILMTIYIPFDTEYCVDTSFNLGETGLIASSNILAITEMMENIYENRNVVEELCDSIHTIANDSSVYEVANLIVLSGLDKTNFIMKLTEEYNNASDDMVYIDIYKALDILKNSKVNECSFILQSASVDTLSTINEALKENNVDKKGGITGLLKNKTKDIDKAKEKKMKELKTNFGNIANKTKDGKIAITTNLALGIEAMKKSVKDFSSKEKEISSSLDDSLSYFKRNIEKALTSDRRESIIKGSIIPSFSKSIKLAIGAGVVFAVNPVLGAISCIGALATSKALTEKERKLLLDEIDIELKVLERELDNVNSDTSSAKYRQLITYKKNLQRESQRIRYRIKVYSKDKVVNSDI